MMRIMPLTRRLTPRGLLLVALVDEPLGVPHSRKAAVVDSEGVFDSFGFLP